VASDSKDVVYPHVGLFVLVHLGACGAVWTGVTVEAVLMGAALYLLRMFGVCAGYHRYFAHRAFSTSRAVQFALACLAQSSGQKSVLWWAAMHRHHHLHSDTENDLHSPRRQGLWHAHIGWIFAAKNDKADLLKVADLARFPELLWLHRFEKLPAAALALWCFAVAGWPGFVIGFLWSTVLLYHATFCINSLAHAHGQRRYLTADESRNNGLLALITLGEGWHNNHHAFPASVRHGHRWWEFDPTYYALCGLRWLGLVWSFRQSPVLPAGEAVRPGARVLERAADQLAESFWDLQAKSEISTPHRRAACGPLLSTPSRDELRARAATMFPASPAIEDVIGRAQNLMIESARQEQPGGGMNEIRHVYQSNLAGVALVLGDQLNHGDDGLSQLAASDVAEGASQRKAIRGRQELRDESGRTRAGAVVARCYGARRALEEKSDRHL
jgi:stearoyl-CoA desaturase (Delta-9 desaturase)